MEQGSLPERYLSRSVIKHIRRLNPKLSVSAAVGNDYANLHGSVSADGIGDTPWIAWVKAMNNFACSGGQIEGARLTMLLPQKVKESQIKDYMADFNAYAEAKNIQLLGGHTQVSEAFVRAQFVVTMLGQSGDYHADKKKIKPGYDIVMVGQAGLMGANMILKEKREELHMRFPDFYLDMACIEEAAYSIADAARMIAGSGMDICYLHDGSSGGVYGALWQMGVWMDKGFEIQHVNIPIRQETIEICEFFNINPYLLDATGCLFAIAKDGKKLVKYLAQQEIEAAAIGVVTEKKEKLIMVNELEHRCLSPVNGDAIHKVLG